MRLGLGSHGSYGSRFEAKPSVPSFSGLFAWYRGDLGVIRDASGNVSTWEDQSGRGNHLTQSNSAKRPPWRFQGGPRGTSCVGPFDNADDLLSAAFSLPQPNDSFVIAVPSVSGAGNGTIIDGTAGNSRRIYTPAAGQGGIFAGGAVNSTWTETLWQRVRGEFAGANSGITIGNAARVAGNAGTGSSTGLTVGIFGDGSGDPSDCMVAEIILYNRILNATEAAEVQAYLTARYAI